MHTKSAQSYTFFRKYARKKCGIKAGRRILWLKTKDFEHGTKKADIIDTLDTLDRDAILDVLEGQSGDEIPECEDGDCGCVGRVFSPF